MTQKAEIVEVDNKTRPKYIFCQQKPTMCIKEYETLMSSTKEL